MDDGKDKKYAVEEMIGWRLHVDGNPVSAIQRQPNQQRVVSHDKASLDGQSLMMLPYRLFQRSPLDFNPAVDSSSAITLHTSVMLTG